MAFIELQVKSPEWRSLNFSNLWYRFSSSILTISTNATEGKNTSVNTWLGIELFFRCQFCSYSSGKKHGLAALAMYI